MIAKIHTGNNFGGLVNYANDIVKKDAVVVASYGVSLTSNAAITASFKAQAKARSGVKNFVGHISLSFSPNDKEKVNNDLMACPRVYAEDGNRQHAVRRVPSPRPTTSSRSHYL